MIRCFSLASLALFVLLGTGCSSAGDQNPPMLAASGEAPTMGTPTAPEVCADHAQGCPCDEPGATIECGRVKRIAGDYVWCSTGKQTCDQYGSWGACIGDALAGEPASTP
ncbi:MAG: hypothetical protein ABW061_07900 [Polyangiaceae bacterium]